MDRLAIIGFAVLFTLGYALYSREVHLEPKKYLIRASCYFIISLIGTFLLGLFWHQLSEAKFAILVLGYIYIFASTAVFTILDFIDEFTEKKD